jgi:hypothetical protein
MPRATDLRAATEPPGADSAVVVGDLERVATVLQAKKRLVAAMRILA